MFITLKALSFIDNKNGTLQIDVETKDPSLEMCKFLEKMFPHLLSEAHRLLEKEALLAALATDADCAVPSPLDNGHPDEELYDRSCDKPVNKKGLYK